MANNKKIKIGYQGVSGAYSEMAAEKFSKKIFPQKNSTINLNFEFIGCKDFEEIFSKIEDENLDFGVLPVENSLAGSIYKNFDLLAEHDFKIIDEVLVHVQHQLLGIKNAKISEIKEVYSHWQALAQVKHTLDHILPNAKVIEYFDTAGSAEMVQKEKDKTKAAVASVKAGQVYNLKNLAKNIQDDKENWTRFVVVCKNEAKIATQFLPQEDKDDNYKTSIVFTGKTEEVGFLFKCLACFSLRNINLTKIESRPIPKQPWKYYFYIDFLGSENHENIKNAISNLKEYCTMIKVLGSYKIAKK
jgi:prephenate dehydratase